jgi:hypothetical protein
MACQVCQVDLEKRVKKDSVETEAYQEMLWRVHLDLLDNLEIVVDLEYLDYLVWMVSREPLELKETRVESVLCVLQV